MSAWNTIHMVKSYMGKSPAVKHIANIRALYLNEWMNEWMNEYEYEYFIGFSKVPLLFMSRDEQELQDLITLPSTSPKIKIKQ